MDNNIFGFRFTETQQMPSEVRWRKCTLVYHIIWFYDHGRMREKPTALIKFDYEVYEWSSNYFVN